MEGLEKREFKRPVKNIKSKAGLKKPFQGGQHFWKGSREENFKNIKSKAGLRNLLRGQQIGAREKAI